jgi:hypothetical protein
VRLCEQTLAIMIPTLQNRTDVDTLTSPALLSPRLAQRAYTIYAVRELGQLPQLHACRVPSM